MVSQNSIIPYQEKWSLESRKFYTNQFVVTNKEGRQQVKLL